MRGECQEVGTGIFSDQQKIVKDRKRSLSPFPADHHPAASGDIGATRFMRAPQLLARLV